MIFNIMKTFGNRRWILDRSSVLRNIKIYSAAQRKRFITSVSSEVLQEFEENGVVCLKGIFNKQWLNICEKGIGRNLMNPSVYSDWVTNDKDTKTVLFFNDYYNFNKFPEYNDYVRNSPAAEIAKQITNSKKIGLFHEHVFYKDSGSLLETPWHHDQAYYPFNGMQNCSIWMPTRKVSKNSSLKFIKGSHKWNTWFVPRLFRSNESYIEIDDIPRDNDGSTDIRDIDTVIEKLDEHTVLQWKLEPGDCIVFHMKTIHGTSASVSDNKRIVMTTRWLGDDMIYCNRPWNTSPPKELLPKTLNYGEAIVKNDEFMSQAHGLRNEDNNINPM